MKRTCVKCGILTEHFVKSMCKGCYSKHHQVLNYDRYLAACTKYNRKRGIQSPKENKLCPQYLGIVVAESILSEIFDDVTVMPNCNKGFDFICNRGMNIDVKASALRIENKQCGRWSFRIGKNTIADFFLCVAFDNRIELNPLYLWLLPSILVCDKMSVSISTSTINKWDDYSLPIDKLIELCDIRKGINSKDAL